MHAYTPALGMYTYILYGNYTQACMYTHIHTCTRYVYIHSIWQLYAGMHAYTPALGMYTYILHGNYICRHVCIHTCTRYVYIHSTWQLHAGMYVYTPALGMKSIYAEPHGRRYVCSKRTHSIVREHILNMQNLMDAGLRGLSWTNAFTECVLI